jgi:hypothetical protein
MPTQSEYTEVRLLDGAAGSNTGLPFVDASKGEPVAADVQIVGRLGRAMKPTEALYRTRAELWRKADLCAGALTEARSHATAGRFGTTCSHMLDRVADLFDEMDEILIGLNPRRDHESFVRVAELHRELEEIQSLTPRAEDSASAHHVCTHIRGDPADRPTTQRRGTEPGMRGRAGRLVSSTRHGASQ